MCEKNRLAEEITQIGGTVGLSGLAVLSRWQARGGRPHRRMPLSNVRDVTSASTRVPGNHYLMISDILASQPEAAKELMREPPIGQFGQYEEIATAVLWLCSPGVNFVISHALVVNGGYDAAAW